MATFIPTVTIVLYFNYLIVGISDLFDAKYLIPIGGMILGNSMKSNIIALERFYGELSTNTRRLFGSNIVWSGQKQGSKTFVRKSILAAMSPIVATMLTIGLVSLPGMMTGQILGGSMPVTAIKYQIAIMLAIFCSNIVGVAMTLKLVIPRSFDCYDMPIKLKVKS